jgi:hypothetical protein
MADECRSTFVPLHPDPDKVLAGTDLWLFPNNGMGTVEGIPPVVNPEMDVWEDGDGTRVTEDPYDYLLLQ